MGVGVGVNMRYGREHEHKSARCCYDIKKLIKTSSEF